MLELGSRQNTEVMDTKRARNKCIANALVCQICWISCSYCGNINLRAYIGHPTLFEGQDEAPEL